MDRDWNPRFLAYATSRGMTPEAALEHDREAYPGGVMCGFVLWINDRWKEWRRARGVPSLSVLGESDHADFDKFIGCGGTR